MAALLLLRAPAWQHCCSRPCWTPAPSPGRGSRRAHRPSEGHSAQLLLKPPLNRQTPLTPPQHPGMPLVMAARYYFPGIPLYSRGRAGTFSSVPRSTSGIRCHAFCVTGHSSP